MNWGTVSRLTLCDYKLTVNQCLRCRLEEDHFRDRVHSTVPCDTVARDRSRCRAAVAELRGEQSRDAGDDYNPGQFGGHG